MKRIFPRSRQRSIIKNYQKDIKLKKNVDILIFLDYMMFLRKLAVEANLNCKETKGKQITAAHVRAVLPGVLKNFRG